MELHTQEVVDVIVLRIEGRIDHLTAKGFENVLLPQLNECTGEKKVVLDLSGVPYMSSAGLRVLMLAARQCQKQQGSIVLAALQPILQEVFRISRFDMLFKIFDTVQAALEIISPTAASAYKWDVTARHVSYVKHHVTSTNRVSGARPGVCDGLRRG